ncbi:hypothetical protein Pmani_021457 [Petrolisthes manimaculis]|uniref:Non-structural maintenance of chromosomes element 4 n=1 Tax=Petrolisthes manimaculis TaxID=1843537 RepID=A0AAE1PG93_9EUCA|nr:hypothetical protein Pmani_021457 [Petrolisthes manimaculis]
MEQGSVSSKDSGMESDGQSSNIVNMSDESNRHVWDTYRDLMMAVQDHTVSEEEVSLKSIHSMVSKANATFKEVKRPQEAAMDAQFLKTCGNLVKLNIESSQSNLRVFKPCEFARKLINFVSQDDDMEEQVQPEVESLTHLIRFGRAVSGLYKSAIGIEPMASAIEWERPPASQRRKREKENDNNLNITKPTQVAPSTEEEQGEAEVVARMYKVLKQRYHEAGNTPLCFFSFAVDPKSYSRTVENMFNISLLVREQFAAITEDDNGIPVIAPLHRSQPQVGGQSQQCLICISHSKWEKIVKLFEIDKAMIPHTAQSHKRKAV